MGRDYHQRQEQSEWPGGTQTWRNTGSRCDLSFHHWEPGLLGGDQGRVIKNGLECDLIRNHVKTELHTRVFSKPNSEYLRQAEAERKRVGDGRGRVRFTTVSSLVKTRTRYYIGLN